MKGDLANIEERLESASQRAVSRLVSALPDEAPSMVWRSDLNEALRARVGRTKRRHRFFWIASPLGLGVACAIVALVMIRPVRESVNLVTVPSVSVANSLEASLVDIHRNDMGTMDVVGAGLNPNEPLVQQSRAAAPNDDSEADLEL